MYDSKVKTNDDVAQKSQVEGRIDRNILDDSRLLFYLKITSELYYLLLAAILDSNAISYHCSLLMPRIRICKRNH